MLLDWAARVRWRFAHSLPSWPAGCMMVEAAASLVFMFLEYPVMPGSVGLALSLG